MLSAMLVSFLCCTTVVADLAKDQCPCRNYVNENGLHVADCNKQKLNSIPDCVPNRTQWLQFGQNNLRYSPGQFQRFENLSYLNLSLNMNSFAARTDSFQFLFKLEYLNLFFTDLAYVNAETFTNQSNLRQLDIGGYLGELKVSQMLFDHLESLTQLNLCRRRLSNLPNWVFIKLPLLRELHLSESQVVKLYDYTFSGLSALKYLTLHDPIENIDLPDKVFKPLVSLEELHLEGICGVFNPSFDCTTIDEKLQHVPSLKRLFIDKALISYIGSGFLSLTNLSELYFVNSKLEQPCKIFAVTEETFANLYNSPLTKLVVSDCYINFLLPSWYKYLTALKEISFSATTVSYNQFWVDISSGIQHTKITKVRLSLLSTALSRPQEPFTVDDDLKLTNLTDLELTDTLYNCLSDTIITKLPKSLKYLNLSHNNIIYFGVKNLQYLENLETLDLSNQVELRGQSSIHGHISPDFFCRSGSKMQNFSTVSSKEAINVWRTKEKLSNVKGKNCNSLPYKLNALDLSKSRLLCNMVHVFCGPNNTLKILNASEQKDRSCFKSSLFWSVLRNLAELEELNLNRNKIVEIPQRAFCRLQKLQTIKLAGNKLIELSFDVKDMSSLRMLDLYDNSIQFASKSFTSQIKQMAKRANITVNLSKNHLFCNCKHLDFVSWLATTNVILKKKKLICTFENGTKLSLNKISQVNSILEYQCSMVEVTVICTAIFLGLNAILAGIAYIWHNRQKLKYLVSYGRRTLNPYHPIENGEIEMEYDVYISYDGDFNVTPDLTLRDLVIYTIVPGLERRGVRVMIREKLDPGRRLYEIITQTLRRSVKVVAFLTNGYCNDIWNVFEFNQAVMEGIYTNRQVAIPVLFESLRLENVKEEICEFLRMEPVHKYTPGLSDIEFINFLYEKIRDTRPFV